MRCKEHFTDQSSSVGVCATCLRERLLALVAAQAQLTRAAESGPWKHDPPPLVFPRSVSPYVSRRKPDDNSVAWIHHQRFYSTPQVGPTYGNGTTGGFEADRSFKKKNRFSLFSNLFRSRSDKFESDPRLNHNREVSDEPSSSSSSPSLFSAISVVRRKKQQSSRPANVEEFGQFGRKDRKSYRITDRGMSPAVEADSGDECDRLPTGISQEASPRWKKTPTASRRARNVSGLAFCMSPLVRTSPNRYWNPKGGLPPDMSFTGDNKSAMKPNLATAAGFSGNRSRKLSDIGTFSYNC